MTEEDQLKQNTDHQRAEQEFKEIQDYLHSLVIDMEIAAKKSQWSSIIYIAAWLAWVIIPIFIKQLEGLFMIGFIAAMAYDFFRNAQRIRAHSEFKGAVKILRILGMLPPPGDKAENKSHFWEEGVAIVKGWFTKKEKAKKEAYA